MKHRFLGSILFVYSIFFNLSAKAQVVLPALIEVDTEIENTDQFYALPNALTIADGITLTVKAGVEIVMGAGTTITNNGRLIFEGEKNNSILIHTANNERWRYISNNGTFKANNLVSKNGTRFLSCNGDTLIVKNCFVDETTGVAGDDLLSAHHTAYIEISGCTFYGDPTSAKIDAIDLDAVSNVLIENNCISNFPDDGIDIGTSSSNVLIKNNVISNCDMGVSVGESSYVNVDRNLITYCGAGIQSHTGSEVTATQNTLYGNQIGVRALHYDSQPTSYGTAYVTNSIIANCGVAPFKLVENSVVTFTNCLNETVALPGEGNVLGDPDFINPTDGNFNLGPNSLAIDAGKNGTAPDGTPLDIGFFERFNAPLIINEISSANLSIYADEANEYDDWFELLNTTDADINLKGYFLSDKENNPSKFEITKDVWIAAGATRVFWADDSLKQGDTHVSFGLSGSGEFLSVSSPAGVVLDSITFPVIPVNHTYGRHPLGRNIVFFTEPTPGNLNDAVGFSNMAGSVKFSNNGGPVVNADFGLSPTVAGDSIRYSTDGTKPGLGPVFSDNFTVTPTKVVRAVAITQNALPGFIQSRLVFEPETAALPVLSLSMDEGDLNGENGIYTNYKNSSNFWERPVSLSYYNSTFQWASNAGIRIQGGNSVFMPKKAFRLFFRAGYGNEALQNSPFKSGPSSFDKLVLRSGYDDDISTSSGTLLRDPFSAEIWKKIGETATESDFVSLYLNGNYWGIYNIRESIDEDFVTAHLNITDFDLIRFLKTGEELKYGSKDSWNQLINFLNTTDFSQPGTFDEASQIMDMNSILNLLAFVHCTAYRSWTWGTFGIKPDNGKWTWTIWDTDRGYSLTSWNGFTEYANTSAEKWSNIIPQKLMANETFQHELINRNCDLLNTLFVPDSAISVLDSLADVIAPEMKHEYDRWNAGNEDGWQARIDVIRNFLRNRPDNLYSQMKSYFSLEDTTHIRIKIEGNGHVQLNSITVKKAGFEGTYMKGIPIKLRALPQKGAEFVGWKGIGDNLELRINPEEYNEITAVFKASNTAEYAPLVINEIMYHPMDLDGGEWIELYNPNAFTVDITNWKLSDGGIANQFFVPQNTLIQPYNYLILAGNIDDFSVRFPAVKNVVGSFNSGIQGFNLSNSGETVILFNNNGIEEDNVSYLDKLSWPEEADGNGPSLQLIDPELDNSLPSSWSTGFNPPYTPGAANILWPSKAESIAVNSNLRVFPNPVHSGEITVVFNEMDATGGVFQLFDFTGRALKTHKFTCNGTGEEAITWNDLKLVQGSYILQCTLSKNGKISGNYRTIIIVQ